MRRTADSDDRADVRRVLAELETLRVL